MKKFMDRDFLLKSDYAKHLFHDYAEKMPIVDYHCHISPKEIYEDRKFDNIAQVWLGGDHYKWRQMRSNGIDEYYITGDASDYEKFINYAKTLEKPSATLFITGLTLNFSVSLTAIRFFQKNRKRNLGSVQRKASVR